MRANPLYKKPIKRHSNSLILIIREIAQELSNGLQIHQQAGFVRFRSHRTATYQGIDGSSKTAVSNIFEAAASLQAGGKNEHFFAGKDARFELCTHTGTSSEQRLLSY